MRIFRTVVWAIFGCSLSLALMACGQASETGGGEGADAVEDAGADTAGTGPAVVRAPGIDTVGSAPSGNPSSRFTVDVASSETADAGTSTGGTDAGTPADTTDTDSPGEPGGDADGQTGADTTGADTTGADTTAPAGCPDGTTDCGGTCVDLRTDPDHCGQCGWTCKDAETCQNGECVCRDGLTECRGHCVDTSTHPDHCGDCKTVCGLAGGGRRCFDGECRAKKCATFGDDVRACAPHERQCVREANMQDNPLHCGACNNTCPSGEVCVDGACRKE